MLLVVAVGVCMCVCVCVDVVCLLGPVLRRCVFRRGGIGIRVLKDGAPSIDVMLSHRLSPFSTLFDIDKGSAGLLYNGQVKSMQVRLGVPAGWVEEEGHVFVR